jgi:transposase
MYLHVTKKRKTPPSDPKSDALRGSGSLNAHPQAVTDPLFRSSDFCDARDLVQVKYEMLRRVRIEGRPVTESAAAFGFSRPSFYQAQLAFEQSGLSGLLPQKPGPRRAHKLSEEVVDFIVDLQSDDVALLPAELVERVEAHFGIKVHSRSIERALARRAQRKKKHR